MNWYAPVAITCLVVALVGWLPKAQVDVWGAAGVVTRLLGFIQSLPGFYLAALAAIATFGSESMQKLMPGTPPTMRLPHNGGVIPDAPLTRRIFLSSMFAYLTALSLLLTVTAIGGLAVADLVKGALAAYMYPWLKSLATIGFLVPFAQLLTITFWGLYYLGERLHLADS